MKSKKHLVSKAKKAITTYNSFTETQSIAHKQANVPLVYKKIPLNQTAELPRKLLSALAEVNLETRQAGYNVWEVLQDKGGIDSILKHSGNSARAKTELAPMYQDLLKADKQLEAQRLFIIGAKLSGFNLEDKEIDWLISNKFLLPIKLKAQTKLFHRSQYLHLYEYQKIKLESLAFENKETGWANYIKRDSRRIENLALHYLGLSEDLIKMWYFYEAVLDLAKTRYTAVKKTAQTQINPIIHSIQINEGHILAKKIHLKLNKSTTDYPFYDLMREYWSARAFENNPTIGTYESDPVFKKLSMQKNLINSKTYHPEVDTRPRFALSEMFSTWVFATGFFLTSYRAKQQRRIYEIIDSKLRRSKINVKTCPFCREPFTPRGKTQWACSKKECQKERRADTIKRLRGKI